MTEGRHMPLKRKSMNTKVKLLSGVSLFSVCNKRELSRIASLVDEIDVEPGKVLTREGDSGWEFFVVADGRAQATRSGRKVGSLGPGSFFGEMSLLDQGPRFATITAETGMHLLVLDSPAFLVRSESSESATRTSSPPVMRAWAAATPDSPRP